MKSDDIINVVLTEKETASGVEQQPHIKLQIP